MSILRLQVKRSLAIEKNNQSVNYIFVTPPVKSQVCVGRSQSDLLLGHLVMNDDDLIHSNIHVSGKAALKFHVQTNKLEFLYYFCQLCLNGPPHLNKMKSISKIYGAVLATPSPNLTINGSPFIKITRLDYLKK